MHSSPRTYPQARPVMAASINAERLHMAVTDAHLAGYRDGYLAGRAAGARRARWLFFCLGLLAGGGLLAVALEAGLLALVPS